MPPLPFHNSEKPDQLALFPMHHRFHGLGDTADGWAGLMPQLEVEDAKFILPTAPERPISINGGYSMHGWSDILGLDMEAAEDRKGATLDNKPTA